MRTFYSYFLIFILGTSLIAPAYSSPIFVFERTPTLEKSLGTSTIAPKIAVDGSDVYSVFIETNPNDILRFEATNIATPTVYSGVDVWDGGGTTMANPEIFVASNGDLYTAVMEDVDGAGGDIIYIDVLRSTDGGATFPIGLDGSSLPDGVGILTDDGIGTGENYKIAADASGNVYIAYVDGTGLYFISAAYDGSGDGYYGDSGLGSIAVDISDTVTNLDMLYNGTKIYIAYEINSAGTKEVKLATSTDTGASFSITNLSNSAGVDSAEPKLSLSGDNVYVIWQENTAANSEVHFRSYDALSTTFGSDIRLDNSAVTAASLTPQIESSGSNVYAVWADKIDAASSNQEIIMRKSTNSGATFASAVSISSSTSDSSNPRITAQGSNLHVVWEDKTIDGTNGELWFRSSSDSGATFGGLQIISESPLSYPSPIPEIASSSLTSAVIWKKSTLGGSSFVKLANSTNIDVSFNKIEFAKTDSATITVDDPAITTGPVNVDIKVDAGGLNSVSLTSCSSGTCTGTIDIDGAPYSASDGSVISAIYTTSFGNFTSFSHVLGTRSIAWSPNDTPLVVGSLYGISVTDASANNNPFTNDTISVSLTTTSVGGATTLDSDSIILSETNTNTGIFSCSSCVAFMPGDISVAITDTPTFEILNDTATVSVQTFSRTLKSSSDATGVSITFTETGATTNTYRSTISFCTIPACSDGPTGTIYAQTGDFYTISTASGENLNGVITPMSTSKRALIVNDDLDSQIDISFNGLTILDRTISDAFSPGGGGGGVSRAGLVVQAVGAIALFGGGSGTSGPPSFDSSVFSLETDGVKTSPESLSTSTSSLTVGKKSDISMGFKMPGGLNDLDHIGLYANIGPGENKYDSDTYIYFDRFKTPQITIHDPHGFFKSVNVDVTEPTKSNIDVNFVFDFAKSLDDTNVVFEAWNIKRDGAIKEIPGLLKVDDPTKPDDVVPKDETILQTTEEKPPVPDWVKSNAAWWGKGEIDDNEFTNGIGYLIQKHIIDVPGLLEKNTSPEKIENLDTGVVEEPEEFTPIVPSWVKNNALWWSEGQLTDDDFLVGIKYLLEKGIIQVRV